MDAESTETHFQHRRTGIIYCNYEVTVKGTPVDIGKNLIKNLKTVNGYEIQNNNTEARHSTGPVN